MKKKDQGNKNYNKKPDLKRKQKLKEELKKEKRDGQKNMTCSFMVHKFLHSKGWSFRAFILGHIIVFWGQ